MTDFVIQGPESHAVVFLSIESRDYFPFITILVRRSPRRGADAFHRLIEGLHGAARVAVVSSDEMTRLDGLLHKPFPWRLN